MSSPASIAPELSFETLYSEPSIIGNLPIGSRWSVDGQSVAFLWNEAGHTFRDIWVWDRQAEKLTRRTFLGQDQISGEPPGIVELAWLADGRIAFVMDGQLYGASADGSVAPLAMGAGGVSALATSRDGRQLAFLSGNSLMVSDAAAPTAARRIVSGAGFVGVESFHWAKDGASIVFVEADDTNTRKIEIAYDARSEARKDRFTRAFPGDLLTRRRVGLVSLGTGAISWFERPDGEDAIWGYGLSPDGSSLFISSSDLSIKNYTIFLFDTRTGERAVHFSAHDPLKIRPDWQVDFAPDGKSLIVLTDRDGFNHLHLLPAAGADLVPLTSGPWEIAEFTLDAANGKIYFIANEAHPAERHVYSVAIDGGMVQRLTGPAGIHVPTYAPDFSAFVDLFSDDRTPPELFVQPMTADAPAVQLTRSPLPAFAERQWAEVRYIAFTSSVDGAELLARVMIPPGFRQDGSNAMVVGSVYSDGLLNQWGGRAAHPSWGIDQYLAARGFVVVSPEIRGSFGRGREWNKAQLNSYGTQDIEDIADCVKTLTGLGYADAKRVGIWGSSYGGLMTLMSLFKKPGLYAAGVAGAPATNVWHAYPEQGWIMGLTEGEDYIERYRAQSALFHTAGLEDELMIIHGTKDEVVLYADTMALVEKMISQGKHFELVTLPGTGHAWSKQDWPLTRFAYGKLAAFFERSLKG
ncbi:prolyl oligopeptidase family serine peptidase [Devosia sp. YIM 151766]|uniref:S9 family peptidase n=1 Tax=Devosia sp. YIM 151766 TaxID=3017325 RepID=UPI00255CF8A7|nr:prolyl oligopeptidase family serine peptidase [Devosia sp. YIM 151766]WIY52721.1 prolyl oligopeptidase family serine peptidase [Devosia sp. YIM 151766]